MLKENEYICIDIIYGMWSCRWQYWIDLIGYVLFLMFFVMLMIWFLWLWVMCSYYSGEVLNNVGGLKFWFVKVMLLVGFIMLFFQGIFEIVKKIVVMCGIILDFNFFVLVYVVVVLEGEVMVKNMEVVMVDDIYVEMCK